MQKRKTKAPRTFSDRAWTVAERASTLFEDAFPSYVDSVLAPGERIIARSRLHWIVYLPSIGLFAGALALRIAIGAIEPSGTVAGWVGMAVAAIATFSLFSAWLLRTSTEIAVTDRRLIHKWGLIWRDSTEMHVDKIESVNVSQSIMGRMLGYGTVTIRGTGAAAEVLIGIREPLRFRSAITAR